MNRWELFFGDVESTVSTISNDDYQCVMSILGYECTDDKGIYFRCPLRNRPGSCFDNQVEWLQEEAE